MQHIIKATKIINRSLRTPKTLQNRTSSSLPGLPAQPQEETCQVLLRGQETREQSHRRRRRNPEEMGPNAHSRAPQDLGEGGFANGERIQADPERRHHAGSGQDRHPGRDRFGRRTHRLLQARFEISSPWFFLVIVFVFLRQVERIFSQGGDQVPTDLRKPESHQELDEVQGHRRLHRGRVAFQLHGDRGESGVHSGFDGMFWKSERGPVDDFGDFVCFFLVCLGECDFVETERHGAVIQLDHLQDLPGSGRSSGSCEFRSSWWARFRGYHHCVEVFSWY